MLLHRSPNLFWRIDEIAAELQFKRTTVASSLGGLHKNGVIVAGDTDPVGYRYEPRSVALDGSGESLVAAYETDPLLVVKVVFSKPPRALAKHNPLQRRRRVRERR